MGSLALNAGPDFRPAKDSRDELIESLREENASLRSELHAAQRKLLQAGDANTQAVSRLRAQLSPLYQALQAVFGEMKTFVDASPSAATGQANGLKRGVWESWKTKLGGKQAEFIDVLLEHGEMTATQLRIATRSATQTVYDTVSKLNKAGLINKNGGKFSLKEL